MHMNSGMTDDKNHLSSFLRGLSINIKFSVKRACMFSYRVFSFSVV